MLFHSLLGFLTTVLTSVYAALPAWGFSLLPASGAAPGGIGSTNDGGAVYAAIKFVTMWDRFIPIYSMFFPIIIIQGLIFAVLIVLKIFFKGASFIPTINAGG